MSKEISIHSLYNDVLKELPFTISGNVSIDKTIFQFLQKVAESPFLVDNKQIKFLMGGFAKIQLYDLKQLFQAGKWETKRLENYFFYDYEDDDVLLMLSLYGNCLKILTKSDTDTNSQTKGITNIICDNNYGGVNFRIKIKDELSKIKIVFNRRDNVLECSIPKCFYNNKFNLDELTSATEQPNVARSVDNDYEFYRATTQEDVKFEDLFKKIFNTQYIPSKFKANFKNFILNVKIEENIKTSILKNSEAKINEIYFLIYSAGLLAYLHDCNIEYFTSVANTIGNQKKSLGSIAVGYKSDSLSNDLRSFFSIISNHLATNLASQIILDTSRTSMYIQYRNELENFILDFCVHFSLGVSSLHDKNFIFDKSLTEEIGFYEINNRKYTKKEIEFLFGEGIIEYLQKVINNQLIDYGMYEGFHASTKTTGGVNLFYKSFHKTGCLGLGIVLQENQINPNKSKNNISKPLANVYLPHKLIDYLQSDSKHKINTIITKTLSASAIIEVTYKYDINLGLLLDNIKSNINGSFISFLIKDYNAFLICGDLIVKDAKSNFSISLKNDFKPIYGEFGQVRSLQYISNHTNMSETKNLIFEIQYNLI
jgi:hypothetical protein